MATLTDPILREQKRNLKKHISLMSTSIQEGNMDCANSVLTELETLKDTKYKCDLQKYFYQHRDKKKNGQKTDLTVLHIAATFETDNLTIVERLLDIEPRLLYLQRQNEYQGQTALHIAIAQGKYKIVKLLLYQDSVLHEKDKKSKELPLHKRLAGGIRFKNTILMGQSPLSVAALNVDTDLIDLLIDDYHADVKQKNTLDETVFHSIIRYSAVYPEKEIKMIEMCKHLNEYLQTKTDMFVWFEKNKDNLTALQLAASLGTVHLFGFIVNLTDVYCFQAEHDGLFDIKMYDITEIDSVTWRKSVILEEETRREHIVNPRTVENVKERDDKIGCGCGCIVCLCPETESVLEMMCSRAHDENTAYVKQLVEIVPVKNVIRLKWEKYRWFHYIWMFIHIGLMSFLTVHSVVRAQFYEAKRQSSYAILVPETYVVFWQILGFLFSILYLFIVCTVLAVKKKKPLKSVFMRFSDNFWYLILLLGFSLCFIIDSSMHWLDKGEDMKSGFLIASLIFGWWFLMFFLRAIYHFSFFTELIGRVIFGDLLRFAVVIGFELISFTAGMCIMFTGRTVEGSGNGTTNAIPDDNFAGYFHTMLTMFKLMLGLGDIEILFEAKSPGIAIALFIFFVILTYVLLLNALIAMMSVTCAMVLEGRFRHWRMQQLSAMMFLEEMSHMFCLGNRLPILGIQQNMKLVPNVRGQEENRTQFLLEIHALQSDFASQEDKDAEMKTMKTNERFQNDRPIKPVSFKRKGTKTEAGDTWNQENRPIKPASFKRKGTQTEAGDTWNQDNEPYTDRQIPGVITQPVQVDIS